MSSSSIRHVAPINSSKRSAVKSEGQIDLGGASEVTGAHLGDAVRLHHRDLVRALVLRDLPADLKALAEQPRDLASSSAIQATAEGVEVAHARASIEAVRSAKAWLHAASVSSA